MAGQRRSRARDAQDPTRRAGRPARRREHMAVRYAAAVTPVARLEVAHDFLRGVAARRHPDPERAAAVVDEAARALIAAADGLLEHQAREPRHVTTTSTRKGVA